MRLRKFSTMVIRQDHWDTWENVTIKVLNTQEVAYINDMSTGVGERNLPTIRIGRSQLYTLVFGIQGWTLTDDYGNAIPWPAIYDKEGNVDAEGLRKRLASLATLASADSTFITTKLNELNAPKSKEELEAFLASAAPGSQASPSSDLPLPSLTGQ